MKAIRLLCIALFLIASFCFAKPTDMGIDPSARFISTADYSLQEILQFNVGMDLCQWSQLPKEDVLASPADLYSVTHGWNKDYCGEPPVEPGNKPVFMDMDHVAVQHDGDNEWNNSLSTPWKLLTRGYHQCMYDHDYWKPTTNRASWEATRHSMGRTVEYANRMDLVHMHPRGDLASTRYCLANPGREYLVYAPDGGEVVVDISAAKGELSVQWFDPARGESIDASKTRGGDRRQFTAPFEGHAVLYLVQPSGIQVDSHYPGGNIVVDRIEGDHIYDKMNPRHNTTSFNNAVR